MIGDGRGRRAAAASRAATRREPPDFGDGALHVLQGMLVDPVVEDMRILGNINMFFADENGSAKERRDGDGPARNGRPRGRQRYREARGKPPYRLIPYIFIAPEKRGAIGAPGARGVPATATAA